MAAFLNACRFNPTAGGTTDWTYSSAVNGYQSPAAAGAVNGRLYKYRAESGDLSQWEIGEGSWNSGTGVLARTIVLFNSAGTTAKINFSATPQVAVVALKEDLISIEEANSFTAAQKTQAQLNLGFSSVIVGAADLNTVTAPGTYACQTNTCTNGPFAGGQWYIDVTTYSADPTNYLMQRAVDLSSPNGSYVRTKVAGVWGAWRKYPGETGTGSAIAGDIGEVVEYTLGGIALTSGAAAVNLVNGAFGAGDWEIWGYIFATAAGATSLTNYTFSVSSTSATHDVSAIDRYDQLRFAGGWSDPIITKTIGPHRRSLSASTTLYLVATATFTSSFSVGSKIRGRRMR